MPPFSIILARGWKDSAEGALQFSRDLHWKVPGISSILERIYLPPPLPLLFTGKQSSCFLPAKALFTYLKVSYLTNWSGCQEAGLFVAGALYDKTGWCCHQEWNTVGWVLQRNQREAQSGTASLRQTTLTIGKTRQVLSICRMSATLANLLLFVYIVSQRRKRLHGEPAFYGLLTFWLIDTF